MFNAGISGKKKNKNKSKNKQFSFTSIKSLPTNFISSGSHYINPLPATTPITTNTSFVQNPTTSVTANPYTLTSSGLSTTASWYQQPLQTPLQTTTYPRQLYPPPQFQPQVQTQPMINYSNTGQTSHMTYSYYPYNSTYYPNYSYPNLYPQPVTTNNTHNIRTQTHNKSKNQSQQQSKVVTHQVIQYPVPQTTRQTTPSNVTQQKHQTTPQIISQIQQEPEEYYCEACEKSFPSLTSYQVHVSSHVSCEVEGCNYKASKKALKNHLAIFHNPQMKQFAKLHTPEEIAKYLEERKKNYPTKENLKRKREEEEKQKERGELTPKKKLGKNHRNKRKIKKPRLHDSNQTSTSNEVPKILSSTETQPSTSQPSSTDEPSSTNQTSLESNQTSSTSEPLSSSQASINQTSGTGTPTNQTEQPRKSHQICRFFQRNRCTKGSNCPFVHQLRERKHYNTTFNNSNNNANHASNNNTSNTNSSSNKPMVKSKPSLLEKLFEKEIVFEKSVILQCLRYIVKNNFFFEEEKPK